ncbi:MAG: hypothetical protein P1V51_01720 [Deltaproteobacteria bacterium]|nr:hypothetical protein [Deltaproteobacteria bacterium]
MKIRPLTLAFLIFATGAATCGGIDRIRIRETATAEIPPSTLLENLVGDLGFSQFATLDLSQNQELQNQGIEKHQIDHVYLQELALQITAPPSGQDFTFIDRLEFFVESDGLPTELLAAGGPFAADLTAVNLDVEDVDLAPYVTAPSMAITTQVQGRRPRERTTIEASLRFQVDVNVGGLVCGGGKDEATDGGA